MAEKILGLRLVPLSIVHLLLTVDETAEVRLLAIVALVEGASVISKLLRLLIVNVMLVGKTLILKDAFVFGAIQSLLFDNLLETEERAKFLLNWLRQSLELDLLLAAWAREEAESDSKGGPLMLQKVD